MKHARSRPARLALGTGFANCCGKRRETPAGLVSRVHIGCKSDKSNMPLYDFRCKQCEAVSELLISAGSNPVCPQCGGDSLEKLLSAPNTTGKTHAFLKNARTVAAAQGHFSNYSRSERRR
jgi:putative FmdB family regulatory protein